MAGKAGAQYRAMTVSADRGGLKLKLKTVAIVVIAAIAVIGGIVGVVMSLGREPPVKEAVEIVTPTPIVTATPAPTATPTAVPTASMVPMKEETISFVLTNETQVTIDVLGERVGYSESSEFNGGFTRSVSWQERQNDYDIVDLPGNQRLEIDWESKEYRGPYTVPELEDFPAIPKLDGKAIAQGFGHIEFQ